MKKFKDLKIGNKVTLKMSDGQTITSEVENVESLEHLNIPAFDQRVVFDNIEGAIAVNKNDTVEGFMFITSVDEYKILSVN